MSTREPEQKPRATERLTTLLQRSRIPLLVTVIVLAVFVIGYFGWTEWERRAREKSATEAEAAQDLYQEWQSEQDPEAKKGLEEELRTLLTEIRKSYPRQYAAQRAAFLEGSLDYGLEQWEPAAQAFESLASRAPDSYLAPLALKNAGVCWERAGKPEEALAAYRRVVDRHEESFLVPEVLFAVGRVEEQQGNYQAAVDAYNSLEEQHPLSNWTKLGRNRIIALEIEGKVAGQAE